VFEEGERGEVREKGREIWARKKKVQLNISGRGATKNTLSRNFKIRTIRIQLWKEELMVSCALTEGARGGKEREVG